MVQHYTKQHLLIWDQLHIWRFLKSSWKQFYLHSQEFNSCICVSVCGVFLSLCVCVTFPELGPKYHRGGGR